MTYKTPLESLVFKETTLGKPTKLESQFRLTYNSIVSLLRIESVKMEDMIQSSFGEDKGQQYKLETKAKEIGYEGLLNSELINELKIDCDDCEDDKLKQLLSKIDELIVLKEEILKISMNTKAVAVKIKTGRVLIYKSVVDQKICFNVGIVFKNNSKKGSLCVLKITEDFHIDFNINANQSKFYIPYMSKMSLFQGGFQITDNFNLVDILINDLEYLVDSENRKLLFMVFANDLSNEKKIPKMVASVIKSLQPFELKGMLDFDLVKKLERQKTLQSDILSLDKVLKKCQNFPLHLFEKWQIEEVLKEAKSSVNNELKLLPDYENRLKVLKSMGFVDDTETVQLKGRVVAEITIGYELVITEIMFDNFMSDLSPEEIVALLSCFVYNGTDTVDSEEVLLTNKLIIGKKKIEEKYNEFLSYSSIYQIPLVNEEAQFLDRHRFQLVNVVYQWASGVSFAEIMKVSPQSEGTIVRIINRLNELCKQLKNASIIVGNSDMHLKFSTAQDLINRDIVFAASLYL
jgi:antiviral helicase SKI2